MNICIFSGRLGKEPENFKYLPDGKAVLNFSIAVDNGFGDKKKTDWVPLAAFGKTAESIVKFCKVGTLIEVEAGYRTSKKEDPDGGKTQYYHNFVVDSWKVLTGGKPAGEATESDADPDSGVGEDEFPF